MKQDLETRRKALSGYAQRYYDGEPLVSDQEFDRMLQGYLDEGGEPLGIGSGYVPHGQKSDHFCPIGSLGKIHEDTLDDAKFASDDDIVVTPKLDGGSAVAYYDNGKLLKIVSRGDGEVGIDITKNLRHSVPEVIPEKGKRAVRGEVILTWEAFEGMDGTHPRNKAVGLSQSVHSDPDEVSTLWFVAYNLMQESNKNLCLWVLKQWNFLVVPHHSCTYKEFRGLTFKPDSDLFKVCGKEVPYDGLVLSAVQRDDTKKKGRWDWQEGYEVAYKFPDKPVETEITDIEWNLRRTGRVVPVAHLKPVLIEGALVSRVTLNNLKWVKDHNLGVGAKVGVVRANMIIPQIIEVRSKSNRTLCPVVCPLCGADLKVIGVDLCCVNSDCLRHESEIVKRVLASRNDKGLGETTFQAFIDHFNLTTLDRLELFMHYPSEIEKRIKDEWPGHYGKLLTEVYISLIEKPVTVEELLAYASIPRVGKSTCRMIGDNISADEFKQCVSTKNFSKMRGHCITEPGYLGLCDSADKLRKLLEIFSLSESDTKSGVQYCMTGSLSKPRKQLEKEFEASGAKLVSASIAQVLITDAPSTSSKYKTAVKRGIPIITEEEFRASCL